jgi:hypothetical protein
MNNIDVVFGFAVVTVTRYVVALYSFIHLVKLLVFFRNCQDTLPIVSKIQKKTINTSNVSLE